MIGPTTRAEHDAQQALRRFREAHDQQRRSAQRRRTIAAAVLRTVALSAAMVALALLGLALGIVAARTATAAPATASGYGWPIAHICFAGDGHALTDTCVDASFVVAEIAECPGGGPAPWDLTAPVWYARGVVTLYEVQPNGERAVVIHTPHVARFYSDTIPPRIVYVVDADDIGTRDFEACNCWSRMAERCTPAP